MYTTNYCNKKQNALEKINKTNSWFFEKFAKIDKSLVMLSKKKKSEKPQIINTTSGIEVTAIEHMDIKRRKGKINELRMNADTRKNTVS